MKRIGEALKKLVISEAQALKVNATREELDILDFYYLDVISPKNCIYGRMTGDCYSPRATELLSACAVPYSGDLERLERTSIQRFNPTNRERSIVFSPIEYYITCDKAKNKELIDFLKGKTDTLEL